MATIPFREWPQQPGAKPSPKQLLPNIVDGMAATRPQASYAEIPRARFSYDRGFAKITYQSFANIINGLAWWLEGTLGKSTTFETVAYMGENDIRYNSCILASVKVGYNLLLPATNNATASDVALFKGAAYTKVIVSGEAVPEQLRSVLEHYDMEVVRAPSVEELLTNECPHYPYQKDFALAKDEPLVSVHTSGTTGSPKPIVLTHAWCAAYIQMLQLEPPEGFESNDKLWQGNRIFSMTPPFHTGNIGVTLCAAIANQTTIVMPLPSHPRNAKLFLDALEHVGIDVALLGPAIVDEIGKDTNLTSRLIDHVETIFWSGGDTSEAAGDRISKHVKLFNINGSSEAAGFPMLRPAGRWTPELWQWICLHPAAGAKFCHMVDDVYELKLVRNKAEAQKQPVFQLFPELDTWEMRDLFVRHPTRPDFWRYRGRLDEIIIPLKGLKINPAPTEARLMNHPRISGAILIGMKMPSLSLLIEPVDVQEAASNPDAFIEEIWPTVEAVNKEILGGLAVQKTKILITDPRKPMTRAGKGTIQRGPTISQYADEIGKIYQGELPDDFEGVRR